MARRILETPILMGRDARRFEERMRRAERESVPADEYRRALETYSRIRESTIAANDGIAPSWL